MDKLFGLYDSEDNLLSVHRTEIGAEKNKDVYIKIYGEGFYVNSVVVHE